MDPSWNHLAINRILSPIHIPLRDGVPVTFCPIHIPLRVDVSVAFFLRMVWFRLGSSLDHPGNRCNEQEAACSEGGDSNDSKVESIAPPFCLYFSQN